MSIATINDVASNPEQWQQVQERFGEILTRSSTDMDFRAELLSDPRSALSKHLGRELPESAAIRFIDPAGVPTVVLPEQVNTAAELSDSDLEAVAGGVLPVLAYIGWMAVGAGAAALGDALF